MHQNKSANKFASAIRSQAPSWRRSLRSLLIPRSQAHSAFASSGGCSALLRKARTSSATPPRKCFVKLGQGEALLVYMTSSPPFVPQGGELVALRGRRFCSKTCAIICDALKLRFRAELSLRYKSFRFAQAGRYAPFLRRSVRRSLRSLLTSLLIHSTSLLPTSLRSGPSLRSAHRFI